MITLTASIITIVVAIIILINIVHSNNLDKAFTKITYIMIAVAVTALCFIVEAFYYLYNS